LVLGIGFIAEGFAVRCEVSIREALSFVIPKRAAQRNLLTLDRLALVMST